MCETRTHPAIGSLAKLFSLRILIAKCPKNSQDTKQTEKGRTADKNKRNEIELERNPGDQMRAQNNTFPERMSSWRIGFTFFTLT